MSGWMFGALVPKRTFSRTSSLRPPRIVGATPRALGRQAPRAPPEAPGSSRQLMAPPRAAPGRSQRPLGAPDSSCPPPGAPGWSQRPWSPRTPDSPGPRWPGGSRTARGPPPSTRDATRVRALRTESARDPRVPGRRAPGTHGPRPPRSPPSATSSVLSEIAVQVRTWRSRARTDLWVSPD